MNCADDLVEELFSSGPLKDYAEKKTLTVEEAGQMLGLSRTAAYQAVWKGEIPSLRIGRRLLVPIAKLNEMLGIKDV